MTAAALSEARKAISRLEDSGSFELVTLAAANTDIAGLTVVQANGVLQNDGVTPLKLNGLGVKSSAHRQIHMRNDNPLFKDKRVRQALALSLDRDVLVRGLFKGRAQLGNEIAINAIKEGTLPYPDGSIIAAIHWTRVPSEYNNSVLDGPFPGAQSFVIGSPVNMQFMVKDSKKYAATGGWGFATFVNGKPADAASMKSCFPCHEKAKGTDLVFTRYAP